MSNIEGQPDAEIDNVDEETPTTELPHKVWARAFGVNLCFMSDNVELLDDATERAKEALVGNLEIIQACSTPHEFGLFVDKEGNYVLRQDRRNARHGRVRQYFLKYFDSMLRIKIAEYAQNRVFLHAGVVGWRGKAIVFPGDSFAGKSTLVAEFVRAGADYYSDEYAVLDCDGRVHPFPRPISLRCRKPNEESYEISRISAESLGGKVGSRPLPIGYILFTKYEDNIQWSPDILTPGQAVIEIISQTIPIRYAPQFSLKVLKKITTNAILLKSYRGDASEFVKSFLDFVDNKALLAKMLNTYSI
jgi:hypothetical protein